MTKKRIIAFLMSVLMLVTMAPFTLAEDLPASELQNVYYKLEHDKELTVGYLGGSVTSGAGASDPDNTSWRGLVGAWFEEKFPNANIKNVNAAIGATGSYFGRYRAKQDLGFATNCPDLLFIEFAVNDIYDLTGTENVTENFESIIRQYYSYNPKGQVIIVFVTDYEKKANDFGQKTAQRNVAEHYGIKYIDCGVALYNKILVENNYVHPAQSDLAWIKYFGDSVHCTDAGYAVYAKQITDYLEEQLLSDSVTRDTSTYTNTNIPETYVAQDSAKVGINGDCIDFASAGFTSAYLNGWTAGGSIQTGYENASFAFEFEGTAVGFWGLGLSNSGDLNWTITSKTDPSKVYTGTTTMWKGAQLSWPVELTRGLPLDTYKVECVVAANTHGTAGSLQKIFIDGDVASIKAVAPPNTEINVSYDPIELSKSEYNNVENGISGGDVKVALITGRQIKPDTTKAGEVTLDNWTLSTRNVKFPQYKYVKLNYYFEVPEGVETPVTQVGVKMCSFTNEGEGWQYAANYLVDIVPNKWTTVYIDVSEFATKAADYCASLEPIQTAFLSQMKIMPFGEVKANALTNGEKFYLGGYGFDTTKPDVILMPEVHTDFEGNKYTYVSPAGSVGIASGNVGAFTSITTGVEALGEEGGTVYIQGDVKGPIEEPNAPARGKIYIRGVGDNNIGATYYGNFMLEGAQDSNFFGIYAGDVEFEWVTIRGGGGEEELWVTGNGHTVTFNENCVTSASVHVGAPIINQGVNVYRGSNVIMSAPGMSYGKIGSIGAYFEWRKTVLGDVNYTFNAGNFGDIFGGSRNGWNSNKNESQQANMSLNGDVNYTFNGGTFSNPMYLGHFYGGTTNGNVIFTVNGGTFTNGNIKFGNYDNYSDMQKTGNEVIIVNKSDAITTPITISDANLCTDANRKDRFVIINNNDHSLSVTIDNACTAEYRILVTGGKLVPVFAESSNTETASVGELLGFRATANREGTVLYIDGQAVTPDAQTGLYTIAPSANVISATFAAEGEVPYAIVFEKGSETATGEMDAISEFEGINIVLPVCAYENEGYRFTGWSYNGTIYNVGANFAVPEGGATFTATWSNEAAIDKAYVSASGDDANSGLSADLPKKTIPAAITALGGNDGTIYVIGEITIEDLEPTTSRDNKVTFEGYADSGVTNKINYYGNMQIYGDTAFKNITLMSTQESYNYSAISSNGNTVEYLEGAIVTGYTRMGSAAGGRSEGTITIDSASADIDHVGLSIRYGGLYVTSFGHTVYNLKKGAIGTFYAGSYYDQVKSSPGNTWSYLAQSGDMTLNISGGTINKIVLGSHASGILYGNAVVNITGGILASRNIAFGIESANANEEDSTRSLYDENFSMGNTAVVINAKEILANGGNVEGLSITDAAFVPESMGDRMVVINNNEVNHGVVVRNANTLSYYVTVNGGKAVPVFEESSTTPGSTTYGEFLGFRLVPDKEGYVPYIADTKLEADENGYYQLAKGQSAITFIDPEQTAVSLTFLKGEESATGTTAAISTTVGSVEVLPECGFKNAGKYFAGWSDGETVYPAGTEFEVGEEGATFTATWQAYVSPLYVDPVNGKDTNGGTQSSPMKTIEGAARTLPTGDLEIRLLGNISITAADEPTYIAERADNSTVKITSAGASPVTITIFGGGGNISRRAIFNAKMIFENVNITSSGDTENGGCGNPGSWDDHSYTTCLYITKDTVLKNVDTTNANIYIGAAANLTLDNTSAGAVRYGNSKWSNGGQVETFTGDATVKVENGSSVARLTIGVFGWNGCATSPVTIDGNFTVIADASVINSMSAPADAAATITGKLTVESKNGASIPAKNHIGFTAGSFDYIVEEAGIESPIYVDAVNGLDTNKGTKESPKQTLGSAVNTLPEEDLEIRLLSDITIVADDNGVIIPERADGSTVKIVSDGTDSATILIEGGGGNLSRKANFNADMAFENVIITSVGGGCGFPGDYSDNQYTTSIYLAKNGSFKNVDADGANIVVGSAADIVFDNSSVSALRFGNSGWTSGGQHVTLDGDATLTLKNGSEITRLTLGVFGWSGCTSSNGTIDGDFTVTVNASTITAITAPADASSIVTGTMTVKAENGGVIPAENEITFTADTLVYTPYVAPAAATLTFAKGEESAEGAVADIETTVGAVVTLPECAYINEGKVFAGWTDGETVYPAGAQYTVAGDVTFTATWQTFERVSPLYIDAVNGSDANLGTAGSPMKTFEAAVAAIAEGDLEIRLVNDITILTDSEIIIIPERADGSTVTITSANEENPATIFTVGPGGNGSRKAIFNANMVFKNVLIANDETDGCGNPGSTADSSYTSGIYFGGDATIINVDASTTNFIVGTASEVVLDNTTVPAIRYGESAWTNGGQDVTITGDATLTLENGSSVTRLTLGTFGWNGCTPSNGTIDGDFTVVVDASTLVEITAPDGKTSTVTGTMTVKAINGGTVPAENEITFTAGTLEYEVEVFEYTSPIYVDAVNGSDANLGTAGSPMKTMEAAVAAIAEGDLEIRLVNDITILTDSEIIIIPERADGSTVTITSANEEDPATIFTVGPGGNGSRKAIFNANMVFKNVVIANAETDGCGNPGSTADSGYTSGIYFGADATIINVDASTTNFIVGTASEVVLDNTTVPAIRYGESVWTNGGQPVTITGDATLTLENGSSVTRLTLGTFGWNGCTASAGTIDGDFTVVVDNSTLSQITAPSDASSTVTGTMTVYARRGGTIPAKEEITFTCDDMRYYNTPANHILVDIVNGEAVYAPVTTEEGGSFAVLGAQVRTEGTQALRYVASIKKDVLYDLLAAANANFKPESEEDDGIGFGFIVTDTEELGANELVKGGVYGGAIAKTVPAVYLFNSKTIEADNAVKFTVALVGIEQAYYKKNYTARPYITYADPVTGEEITVYGETYTTNVYDVAVEAVSKGDPDSEYLQTNIIDKA